MRRLLWIGLCLAACGGDDDDQAAPGTLTVVTSGVTGWAGQNRLLITEARASDGRQAAIHCAPIDADPFSSTVVLETIVGPTPCEDSSAITLDPGRYDLLTAVIMGGSMTPDECAAAQVTVDGDVTVTMPALSAAACN